MRQNRKKWEREEKIKKREKYGEKRKWGKKKGREWIQGWSAKGILEHRIEYDMST